MKQFSHQDPLRPLVILITDQAGYQRSRPVDLDLSAQFRRPLRTIVATTDPASLSINPRTYLDTEAA